MQKVTFSRLFIMKDVQICLAHKITDQKIYLQIRRRGNSGTRRWVAKSEAGGTGKKLNPTDELMKSTKPTIGWDGQAARAKERSGQLLVTWIGASKKNNVKNGVSYNKTRLRNNRLPEVVDSPPATPDNSGGENHNPAENQLSVINPASSTSR